MIRFFKRLTAAAVVAGSFAGAANAASFLGEFWNVNASVSSLAQAKGIIANSSPTATFTATALDYYPGPIQSIWDINTLSTFLGADATTLSGAQSTLLFRSVFRFTGTLELAAGPHSIAVGSDDGFGLTFNGSTVAEFTGLRGFGTTTRPYVSSGSPVDFELVFFENGGLTGLEFRIDNTIVTDAMAYTPSVPLPAALPLMAGAVAALGLTRRRRARTG